jgi:3-carboxy-cis,cis-muconate cycloisomerase
LVREHRQTVMIGRTHAQPALPITFGLKAANWIAPHLRHRQRLRELKPRLLVVQFGGAAGTLAALGSQGLTVQNALAQELGLGTALLPWHTQRDTLVEFASWLSLVSGILAKMAQDVILLAQSEVGELHETDDTERGGSSTMPQKQNPIISEVIIAAARTNASLLSAMHNALIQEHERGTHGWQMEWLALPQMMSLTAAALDKAVFLSENLVVNPLQMQRNIDATHGLMLSEAISLALTPHLGKAEAKRLVKLAGMQALRDDRHLVDVIRELTDVSLNWTGLKAESAYLGATDMLINQVLSEAESDTV